MKLNKFKATQKEHKKYKDLNKAEQVHKLDSLGLSKSEIRDLKYEKDRVNKLLELMKDENKWKHWVENWSKNFN